jgi:hypothetical protein
MAGFIVHRNIHRFQELLKLETDATQRGLILSLLAEEEAKLAGLHKPED